MGPTCCVCGSGKGALVCDGMAWQHANPHDCTHWERQEWKRRALAAEAVRDRLRDESENALAHVERRRDDWARQSKQEQDLALAQQSRCSAVSSELSDVTRERDRLRAIILRAGLWREAPCCLCGYDGPWRFNGDLHPCASLASTDAGGKP